MYINGTSQLYIPARIDEAVSDKIREVAVRAYRLLGCSGLARVDFFVTEDDHKVVLNEINTLPGFTSISMYPKLWMAMGLSYGELLDRLIDLAFKRQRQRDSLTYSYETNIFDTKATGMLKGTKGIKGL